MSFVILVTMHWIMDNILFLLLFQYQQNILYKSCFFKHWFTINSIYYIKVVNLQLDKGMKKSITGQNQLML